MKKMPLFFSFAELPFFDSLHFIGGESYCLIIWTVLSHILFYFIDFKICTPPKMRRGPTISQTFFPTSWVLVHVVKNDKSIFNLRYFLHLICFLL